VQRYFKSLQSFACAQLPKSSHPRRRLGQSCGFHHSHVLHKKEHKARLREVGTSDFLPYFSFAGWFSTKTRLTGTAPLRPRENVGTTDSAPFSCRHED
jgi:hypothetical protein